MIKNRLHNILIVALLLLSCNKQQHKLKLDKNPAPSILENILEKQELKVAIINNSVDYFIYRGTPMGFHYELAKEYAKHLGVRVAFHVAPDYAAAIAMITKGECDILASNVSITGSRKKKMLFTSPFLRSNPVLVQNKNSSKQYVEDWLDVDSLKIAIPAQSTGERIVQNIEETLGLCMSVSLYSGIGQEQLIDWVAEDSIVATLADKIVAKVAKTYYPQLDISIDAGLSHNMAWAVGTNAKKLLKNVNDWLAHYKKSKKYRLLYTKYLRNKKSIIRNKKGSIASSKRLSPYDKYIKKEAKILGWDWRLLAALIYTESRFDASQVSWAGAFGLMQMMPVTAHNFGISRNSSPQKQLEAGRKYIQYLEKEFATTMIDHTDLKIFVLAAYNSGLGHIIDARNLAEKEGKNKDKWQEVVPYALLLSNSKYYNDEMVKYGYFRGRETVNHVARIVNIFESYKDLFNPDSI